YDGKAKTHAGLAATVLFQPVKLGKDLVAVLGRYADSGVMHFQPGLRSRPPGADQDAAGFGILDRVRHKVLRDPAQEDRVAVHRKRTSGKAQPQPPGGGGGLELVAQALEQRTQADGFAIELDPLRVEARNVKDGADQ